MHKKYIRTDHPCYGAQLLSNFQVQVFLYLQRWSVNDFYHMCAAEDQTGSFANDKHS